MKTTREFRMAVVCFVILFIAGTGARGAENTNQVSRPVPTVYIIGDSTVRNSTKGQVGWGDLIGALFDRRRIKVENHALGGRSSRTYYTEGLWDKVLSKIQPGDFVLMQFGHNDGGGLNDPKGRASVKGIGEETKEVEKGGKLETVHTYGWYLRQYIQGAKEKGAVPIVLSPVPRNIWKADKVARAANDYGKWARETAGNAGVFFVDLNEIVAERYERDGQAKVQEAYFEPTDHTHTTAAGAKVNAECVAKGVRALKECALAGYLLPNVVADESGGK